MHACVCTCTCTRVCARVRVCVCLCVHLCVRARARVDVCTRVQLEVGSGTVGLLDGLLCVCTPHTAAETGAFSKQAGGVDVRDAC